MTNFQGRPGVWRRLVRMNKRMWRLLKKLNLSMPLRVNPTGRGFTRKSFVVSRRCVLLRKQYKYQPITKKYFHDKTGYECFVNYVHLKFDGTRGTLRSCLEYCANLETALIALSSRRHFKIHASFSGDGSVVRFHTIRPGENWSADDLEGYKEEAVLQFVAGELRQVKRVG